MQKTKELQHQVHILTFCMLFSLFFLSYVTFSGKIKMSEKLCISTERNYEKHFTFWTSTSCPVLVFDFRFNNLNMDSCYIYLV